MVGFRRVTLMCLLAATALGAWPGLRFDPRMPSTPLSSRVRSPSPASIRSSPGFGVLVQLDGSASSDPADRR